MLKAVGKNIIVYSDRTREKGIIIQPDLSTYKDHKKWKYEDCFIYAMGNEIENKELVIGDEVILDPLTPVRHFDKITKLIERLEEKKMKYDKDEGYLEGYFACKEDNIIAVIKK